MSKETKEVIKIVTPEGRLSFPTLFVPKATGKNGKGEPQYSVQLLLPKGDETTEAFVKELRAKMSQAVVNKWPDEKKRPKKLTSALKDGDTWEGEDGCLKKDKYPEVAGHWVLNANNKKRKPGVVDKNFVAVMAEDELKSGDYGRISFQIYAYDNEKMGVGFSLQNVQMTKSGTPFAGGGSTPEEDFGGPAVKKTTSEDVDPMFA